MDFWSILDVANIDYDDDDIVSIFSYVTDIAEGGGVVDFSAFQLLQTCFDRNYFWKCASNTFIINTNLVDTSSVMMSTLPVKKLVNK